MNEIFYKKKLLPLTNIIQKSYNIEKLFKHFKLCQKNSSPSGPDLNGNLISDSEGNEYAYDEKNRLIYSKVNGKVTEYEIGADGLRKSKTTNGITTDYLVDRNGNVIREDEREDITWGNKPLAKKCYSGQGIFGDNYWDYYYIYNGHGDVVAMVDSKGNIVNEYSYDPWGKITSETETVDNSIKYAGEYYDESGLIYLRNRYYNPSIGRFISEDPARDELNWYAYCGNNPVNFFDPNGLSEVWIREWFEEKNGSVVPNITFFMHRLKSITVSLPGQKSKTYTNKDYIIKNNYAYIDDSVLNKDFKVDGVYSALIIAYGERGTKGSTARQWMKTLYPDTFNATQDSWCITFVSWTLNKANLGSPKTFNVAVAIDWYVKNGAYSLVSDGATPKLGDTMFIGTNHSGLVIAYDSPWVYTIEGCSEGDKVNVVKRKENTITGYGSNGGTDVGVVPKDYDYIRWGD